LEEPEDVATVTATRGNNNKNYFVNILYATIKYVMLLYLILT